jgi:hypothetical protein
MGAGNMSRKTSIREREREREREQKGARLSKSKGHLIAAHVHLDGIREFADRRNARP